MATTTLTSLSPRTEAATELLSCFKTLAKLTEPKELTGTMPVFVRLVAAVRQENGEEAIPVKDLREEVRFLYHLHRMSEEQLLEAAKLIRGKEAGKA